MKKVIFTILISVSIAVGVTGCCKMNKHYPIPECF